VVGDATVKTYLPAEAPALPQSYITPNANGTQNGRVPVSYHELAPLRRLAGLREVRDGNGTTVLPGAVLLAEQAPYVVIDYGPGRTFDIRKLDGKIHATPNTLGAMLRGRASAALKNGVIVGAELIGYDGSKLPLTRIASSRPLATFGAGDFLLAVDLTAPISGVGEQFEDIPWRAHASLRQLVDGAWQQKWYFTSGGEDRFSCAAIDSTGQAAIATKDGHFYVVGPNGTADGRAAGKVSREVATAPYLMSSIENNWLLVEPRRPPPIAHMLTGMETFDDLVGRAKALKEQQAITHDLYVDPSRSKMTWKTRLVSLEQKGGEIWSAEVNFRVLSPPVDATGGVIVVVGEGIAAISSGKVQWSESYPTRAFATAFVDGTLAVAVGRELRIMSPDKTVRQVLETPENEPITAPPAIGKDGSVWLATRLGLYVAR